MLQSHLVLSTNTYPGCVSGPTDTVVRIQDAKFKPKQIDELALPKTTADIAALSAAAELS
jgi:hypothetical protein